jgi:uncharacterized membrane protein
MNTLALKNHRFSLLLIVCCAIIFTFPSASAYEYYADISIDVDDAGFVTIEGITNHPNLLVVDSSIYTSKKQSYWVLNITIEDLFSDILFEVTFPKGTSINYLKTSAMIRLETGEESMLLKGFGENETFFLIVQYQIEKSPDGISSDFDNSLFILIICITLYILITIGLFWWFNKTHQTKKPDAITTVAPEIKGLNERQKQILHILEEKKVPLTQTDIQKEINIPKAAVSRNIRGLERKGLIEKEQIGMSNLIRLKRH